MRHHQRQQHCLLQHVLRLLQFGNIIEGDVWVEGNDLFLQHFDKVGIGSVAIGIARLQEGFSLFLCWFCIGVLGVDSPRLAVIAVALCNSAVIAGYRILCDGSSLSGGLLGSWFLFGPNFLLSFLELPISLLPLSISMLLLAVCVLELLLFTIVKLVILVGKRCHLPPIVILETQTFIVMVVLTEALH
jgi:hypothetical protein